MILLHYSIDNCTNKEILEKEFPCFFIIVSVFSNLFQELPFISGSSLKNKKGLLHIPLVFHNLSVSLGLYER
ncbi:MAG: hypothetical protein Fur0023_13700 [Bacteroidia bacterium]